MKSLILAPVVLLALAGCAGASQDPVSEGGRSRAEVQADLAMWKRAGMDKYYRGHNTQAFFSPEYRRRYAQYESLRNGPAYQQELERLRGRQSD
ncbi:Uncharacterised protein [Bordetella ansorpii]|uniref:Lipoprotein n=1 Tax=Bordetella ansorpii TaxID=288768 RepID=A0A157RPV4_9BORD|nr:DUF4148 domain-containing protein [Bordetella ansorpii]SAI60050.1 Uncharacterised protein [Bordetella ansorpii]SAI65463.1 Uncharacterised protein [Bordetella ansorpii]